MRERLRDNRKETGDKRQETRDNGQETGDNGQETGDNGQDSDLSDQTGPGQQAVKCAGSSGPGHDLYWESSESSRENFLSSHSSPAQPERVKTRVTTNINRFVPIIQFIKIL